MILEALSTARDLGRLNDIAVVLIRHGLGDVVRRLGMAGLLEKAGRALHWDGAEGFSREPEVRFREALEQLGPTFVKLGQILSGRSDLLPPEWTAELTRLQEEASPVALEAIREQLVEDLGTAPEEVFARFDETPLASASIAQVHRATLIDGTEVVLKVRRPGIREVVEADLRLLQRLAEAAEENMEELRRFRPKNLIRFFARSLRDELDLRIEARNTERLRENLAEDSAIVIPRVHDDWTHERLCVTDFLEGPSVGDWLRSDEYEREHGARIAAVGADAVLHAVLVDGCYHADPHPGNMVLLPDGRIGLLDFGMIGRLSDTRRREFVALLVAVVERNVDEVMTTLLGWSDAEIDQQLLEQDCAAFIDRYHGMPLGEIDTSELLGDLTDILRANDLHLPSDMAMLLKVFVTLDGLGRALDPGFVMAAHVEPFAKAAWRREHSPRATLRRGLKEMRALIATLPRDLRQLAIRARRGNVRIQVDIESLEEFGQTIDRSANRMTVGLVTAALIVGTSISLTVSGGPELGGFPVFGLLGFSCSLVAGVWLLWSIFRSGAR